MCLFVEGPLFALCGFTKAATEEHTDNRKQGKKKKKKIATDITGNISCIYCLCLRVLLRTWKWDYRARP